MQKELSSGGWSPRRPAMLPSNRIRSGVGEGAWCRVASLGDHMSNKLQQLYVLHKTHLIWEMELGNGK